MPTTGDLIDLNTLVLTDTFNTWLNRTNQIIDSINPLQVYDVDVGVGSTASETGAGLAKYTGEVAGNYNGVITLGVNPGPGIAYESLSGQSRTIVDFRYFDDYGRVLGGTGTSASPSRVASSDEYLVNDISDTSSSAEGTVKKIQARHMLPPEVAMDVLTISGDVIIKGSLSTLGANDFIASNNLRIEDKQIELAYQQSIGLGMTGVTSGSFTAGNLGATAYYFVNGSTTTPVFYGHLQSFTAAAAGPTGVLFLGALFQDPYGPEDVGATGFISLSSTGANGFEFYSNLGITASFLSNSVLSEGGIVLKGSEGDKSWLWIWQDTDTGKYYDSWQTNSNISINGNTNAVISRVYRSAGYTGVNQSEFIFAAENGKNAEMIFAETSSEIAPLNFTGGSWKITKQNGTNYLIFSTGATGISSYDQNFLITPGASGTTYSGIPVNNYAKSLNADMVDGAHASTTRSAYSIPVALSDGRVDGDLLNADAIRRRYTQASHGLTFGQAVRFDITTGGFTAALATTPEKAEAVGIVSSVESSSQFVVTHQGRIDGISGASMTLEGASFTAGVVYFLGASAASVGKFTSDPDYSNATKLLPGQIRKPMLLALSATQGYVMDHPGGRVTPPTDLVYLSGIVPVGSIYPYSGRLDTLPSEWLVCDGDRYLSSDYPELYNAIGTNYDARIVLDPAVTGTGVALSVDRGVVVGGARRIQVGDRLKITTTAVNTVTVTSVNTTTGLIVFSGTPITVTQRNTYVLNAHQDSAGVSIFFVPDLRSRTIIGGNTGDNQYNSNTDLTAYTRGNLGGSETNRIGPGVLPGHQHGLTVIDNINLSGLTIPSGGSRLVSNVSPGGDSQTGNAFDIRQPYIVTHFIIKALPGTGATILTGHNHDDRYHPLQGSFSISGGNATYGVWGVYHPASYVTRPGGQTAVMKVFYSNDAGRLPTESKTETWLYGDFTLWGDGTTSASNVTGHVSESFAFDTRVNQMYVLGNGTGRPNPKFDFINVSDPINAYTVERNTYVPVGRISGLTMPSYNHSAVNKFYSDTSDKTVPANIAGYYGDWAVRHPVAALGSRPTVGPAAGIDPLGTAILQTRYDAGNGSTLAESRCQTFVFGDLTVYGDGLTSTLAAGNRTGHNEITLAVDPMKSQVTIEGSDTNLGKPPPVIDMLNSAASERPIGKIKGLTAPTQDDQAANKWYVDQNRNREVVNISMAGGFYEKQYTLRSLYHPSRQRGQTFISNVQDIELNLGYNVFDYKRMIVTAPFDWSYCKLTYLKHVYDLQVATDSSISGLQRSPGYNFRNVTSKLVSVNLIRTPRPSNTPIDSTFSLYKEVPFSRFTTANNPINLNPYYPTSKTVPFNGDLASSLWFGDFARSGSGDVLLADNQGGNLRSDVGNNSTVYDRASIAALEFTTHLGNNSNQSAAAFARGALSVSLTGNTPFDPNIVYQEGNLSHNDNLNAYLQNKNLYLCFGGCFYGSNYTGSGASQVNNAGAMLAYIDLQIEFFREPIFTNRQRYVTDLDPNIIGQNTLYT